MHVLYTRVSTDEQNDQRQKTDAEKYDKIYSEKVSGAIAFADRKEGRKLLNDIKKGIIKTITVKELDRLGRLAKDIQDTVYFFRKNNIQLHVENLGMSLFLENNGVLEHNGIFQTIVDLLANLAEMERKRIKERQAQGIAIAKANGKYKNNGRKLGEVESKADFLKRHKQIVEGLSLKLSVRQIARMCSASPTTVQKVKKILANEPIQTTLEGQIAATKHKKPAQ